MRYFLLLLINITLYASTYPSFTYKEAISIEKASGKEAVSRIYKYNETIQSYKKHSPLEQLTKTNTYLNELKYKNDMLNSNQNDYWATPKEFLITGRGDCEDYAIIKYFTLIKLGFSPEKLFITIAYDMYSKSNHMVLSYFIKDNEPPLILDNANCKIVNLTKRRNLKITAFLNTNGVYVFNNKGEITKTKYNSQKFKNLLKRIKIES